MLSSKNSVFGSINRSMRSRAVSRPLPCCDSMAFAPPPWRICSSWLRMAETNSAMLRIFFSKRAEVGSTLVGSLLSSAMTMGKLPRLTERRKNVQCRRSQVRSRVRERTGFDLSRLAVERPRDITSDNAASGSSTHHHFESHHSGIAIALQPKMFAG